MCYGKMDSFLMSLCFTKSKVDSNLYFKVEDGRSVMLLLYVDDLFLAGVDELIVYAKRKLATEFEMKDLGMMHYFLGMEVWQSADGSVAECGWDFPCSKKACRGDFEEIQNVGLQSNGHNYGIELEAIA